MFTTFANFEQHEKSFNTFFATGIAIAVSLLVGGVLAVTGVFDRGETWFLFMLLVLIPIVTYVATAGNSEFRTAYYKTWRDMMKGRRDQYKILERFARQYNIKDWQTKLEGMDADGRWNFHADTDYMHFLTEQRDLLINKIYAEYITLVEKQDREIRDAQKALRDAEIELNVAEKKEESAKELIKDAKTPGEIYKQRQVHALRIDERRICQRNLNTTQFELKNQEASREKLDEMYDAVVLRVIVVYYERYSKYTERAVKKINAVNNLKYTIVDMPSPKIVSENNLTRKGLNV